MRSGRGRASRSGPAASSDGAAERQPEPARAAVRRIRKGAVEALVHENVGLDRAGAHGVDPDAVGDGSGDDQVGGAQLLAELAGVLAAGLDGDDGGALVAEASHRGAADSATYPGDDRDADTRRRAAVRAALPARTSR